MTDRKTDRARAVWWFNRWRAKLGETPKPETVPNSDTARVLPMIDQNADYQGRLLAVTTRIRQLFEQEGFSTHYEIVCLTQCVGADLALLIPPDQIAEHLDGWREALEYNYNEYRRRFTEDRSAH
jgi:hypothetical protein